MAATTAATALAPLLPIPLASGRPLWIVSDTPRVVSSRCNSASTAADAVFFRGSGRQPAAVAVNGGNRHARFVLRSGDHDIAGFVERKPQTSKPQPTFETDPGA